jgi:hypothetical protein
MVASRADPGFASTENPIVPDPEPLPPAVMCTHVGSEELAVHEQPAPAVIAMEPAPPPDANDWLSGLRLYEQGAAACDTVKVRPATVRVPMRWAPVFAVALNCTRPSPAPELPDVIVSQDDALLLAVQAQPDAVCTFTVPVPPAVGTFCEVGSIVKLQPAVCVTVN